MLILSRRNALIGYLSCVTAIVGLMLMIFSGVSAVQLKPAGVPSKISVVER